MVWDGGLDAQYRDALARPHSVYLRADVLDRDGNVLQADLPFIDGNVRATLSSRVARSLTMSLDREWFPLTDAGAVDTEGLLTPFGNRLRVFRGVLYGDGSVASFPAFYGRIEQVSMGRNGQVSLTANDLAADIVDAQFETPEQSVPSNTISVEFRRLIIDALPDATFGTSDLTGLKVAPVAWQSDRAGALDDMSATASMTWYPLADGSFVQRLTPWTKPGQVAQIELVDGTDGGNGTITDWGITISRTSVYNSVVFASERQDGTPPVYAIVRDTDKTSPTYFLGNFGQKPLLVQNQIAMTQTQCLGAAQNTLKQAKAITQVWDPVTVVPDASLELGDLVSLRADGAADTQVITGFTLPLRETGDMTLNLRAYAPVS